MCKFVLNIEILVFFFTSNAPDAASPMKLQRMTYQQ